MAVEAVQHLHRMRGGSQSQLMLGADSHVYVVKFQNNPQHLRVLANEWIATHLAAAVGLPVPSCEIIEVGEWLIENTPDLVLELASRREKCKPGPQFGSRFLGAVLPGRVAEYLEEDDLLQTANLNEFAGVLALDKWTGNVDGRQAIFRKKARERRYHALFIDQGFCFNAGEWRFADAPLRGVYVRKAVYREVTGWNSFEPWLSRIEEMTPEKIVGIGDTMPPEWYSEDAAALERLTEQLIERRGRVRELIEEFRKSSRAPFPKWPERWPTPGTQR